MELMQLMPGRDMKAAMNAQYAFSRPRWVIVSEEVEQSPREKVLKAGRVVKRAEYVDRNKYSGADLKVVRREHGVGRPPRWRADAKDYR